MIHLYQIAPNASIPWPRYCFIDTNLMLFSADYDSLEQLIDVRYCPEDESLNDLSDIERLEQFYDIQLLCIIDSLDNLEDQHPELFI